MTRPTIAGTLALPWIGRLARPHLAAASLALALTMGFWPDGAAGAPVAQYQPPLVLFTKQISGGVAAPGEQLTYRVTFRLDRNVRAVTLEDSFLNGLTLVDQPLVLEGPVRNPDVARTAKDPNRETWEFRLGDLPAGDYTLTYAAQVPGTLRAGQSVSNTVNLYVEGGWKGKAQASVKLGEASYVIQTQLRPSEPTVPGLGAGPPRPVGVVVGPDGTRDELVLNEVVFHPKSQADLQAFLAQYGGTVLDDGSVLVVSIPGASPRPAPQPSGTYLIQVNPQKSTLDDLAANLRAGGLSGQVAFSSEEAARLAALIAREKQREVSANLVGEPDACAVCEHPERNGGFVDAATFPWLTEDDDPATAGVQGLSTGVIRAWEYLAYLGVPPPPPGGTWSRPTLAIIDRGFDLDDKTGFPNHGNFDYGEERSAPPLQVDIGGEDFTAGSNQGGWHGQGVFGIAAAEPNNRFGSAGTGGGVVRPLLIKTDFTLYNVIAAVRAANASGADVINMSFHVNCDWWCSRHTPYLPHELEEALAAGAQLGVINVASAGNIDQVSNQLPCRAAFVLCVGAIDLKGARANFGNGLASNYGGDVDIWAPGLGLLTTPNPETAGKFGKAALPGFSGTSAAAPFVAGIVGLMKALDPEIRSEKVVEILRSTANPSPTKDPRVTPGYVDAFRTVQKVRPNQPPTVRIAAPADGASVPWAGASYRAENVRDREPGGQLPDAVSVVFSSSRDGAICQTQTSPFTCSGTLLSLGTHMITVFATDQFGARGEASVTVTVVNAPPTATIHSPATGSTFSANQFIRFRGSTSDPEGEMLSGTWFVDGKDVLGTGPEVSAQLPQGDHLVALTVKDKFGAVALASVAVKVVEGAGLPTARITEPKGDVRIGEGKEIAFIGKGTDPEDGDILFSKHKWTSNQDGDLGIGTVVVVVLSGPPDHRGSKDHLITLEVTDTNGNTATDQVRVTVDGLD